MSPVIPHFVAECLEQFKVKGSYNWPTINKEINVKKIITIVFQVNGKKKDLIKFDKNVEEKNVLDKIKSEDNYKKHLMNKKIIKVIYIKDRLINLIIE